MHIFLRDFLGSWSYWWNNHNHQKAKNETEAKLKLISTFDFSDLQAQAILDMQLKKLTGLERAKLEEELKALRDQIMRLETLLKDVFKIIKVIRDELLDLKRALWWRETYPSI